jgi:hypothetical protein
MGDEDNLKRLYQNPDTREKLEGKFSSLWDFLGKSFFYTAFWLKSLEA